MLAPIFPISVKALQPLSPYATFTWLAGVVCLWLTRYTHQLGRRWGVSYYAFSAVVRLAGVLLIGVGWLALYAPLEPVHIWEWGTRVPWLGKGSVVDTLCAVAIVGFFGLGIGSSFVLPRSGRILSAVSKA